ncbi:kinase-like protein [Thelephora terrestris]|uniref:Kinase-like protein n=1 Tax=Thelephora terrestris TaxID=56493 RepID=A0A9P6L709_9AGAM|nr:kinase-like protein [Thelephora terrestris]
MSTELPNKLIGAVEDEWQLFSNNAKDYTLGATIGFGASSIVYSATYKPRGAGRPTPVALKVLDLDRLPQQALRLLQRETQLMSLSKHPHVLRVRGTWMDGHKLYIALRLMNAGSAADVMYYGWVGGMEEEVVKCILKQALEGINYLHINGLMHRDIKAANLLIDDDGTVLLGDLGVATFLCDPEDPRPQSSGSDQRRVASFDQPPKLHLPHPHAHSLPRPRLGKRKSFVGTPCWMAPEVIQGHKYDAKADIWSFGITALELAQGRPPRSRESPRSVLLKTVQDPSPTLDRTGGSYKYSKAFQEMVDQCLAKDPAKRPSAAELLSSPFFRTAKKKSHLVGAVLKSLPPLAHRQERRKRASSTFHNTMDSWDFTNTLSLSVKRPSSTSRSSSPLPDEVPHTADPVFELDEDRGTDKDQPQDDSEESSTGPSTPGPTTPVLAGLSSPPKNEVTNQNLSISPEDGRKPDLCYNPRLSTSTPIPTRVNHVRSASRSAPGSPSDLNDVPATVPDKSSQGSKLWNKLTRGSTRGRRLSAVSDKTGTLVRVMSAGFSGKSSRV